MSRIPRDPVSDCEAFAHDPPGVARIGACVAPPTELELMLLHDGEIIEDDAVDLDLASLPDEERAAVLLRSRAKEIEQWLAQTSPSGRRARGFAAEIALVGELLRAEVSAPPAPIAASVMALIEADAKTDADADAVVPAVAEHPRLSDASPVSPPAPSITPPVPAAVVQRFRARSWVAGSGLALAAAACALFALRAPDSDGFIGEEPPVPAMLVASAPITPALDNGGVAVDTVDFGDKMGTIFLQRGGASVRDGVTTVVWIRDEDPRP